MYHTEDMEVNLKRIEGTSNFRKNYLANASEYSTATELGCKSEPSCTDIKNVLTCQEFPRI